jgi:hypothetical protein
MKGRIIASLALLILSACATEMWIPLETSPRQPVMLEQVAFLQEPPDKPYTVVGIITPPPGEYDTEAEAVKAIRRVAALHGASAVYIESQTTAEGWKFSASPWGASGGTDNDVIFRAKAIVWK